MASSLSSRLAGIVVGLSALGMSVAHGQPARAASSIRPRIVITVFEKGLNVLHSDFRLRPGERLRLPPGVPDFETISLPTRGSFEERREAAQAGRLGNLQRDHLYWIAGTRILLYEAGLGTSPDVFFSADHGTGVASAAVGLRHGTHPNGIVLLVHGAGGAGGWEWAAQQRWIDLYSTSYISLGHCSEATSVEEVVARGRPVFAGAGNEIPGTAASPSGLRDAYQVGGVDAEGRSFFTPAGEGGIPGSTTRPYETGDRFDFDAASSTSLNGSEDFGGTSGAAPSTAGRAATILQRARSILDAPPDASRHRALAAAGAGARLPRRGPLADGDLTREELETLLHRVAQPAESPGPHRYLVEGYGALNDDATELALRVLSGRVVAPDRSEEDDVHQVVESLRPVATAAC